jgi:hypothetical protein
LAFNTARMVVAAHGGCAANGRTLVGIGSVCATVFSTDATSALLRRPVIQPTLPSGATDWQRQLADWLQHTTQPGARTLYYSAIPPPLYPVVVEQLQNADWPSTGGEDAGNRVAAILHLHARKSCYVISWFRGKTRACRCHRSVSGPRGSNRMHTAPRESYTQSTAIQLAPPKHEPAQPGTTQLRIEIVVLKANGCVR